MEKKEEERIKKEKEIGELIVKLASGSLPNNGLSERTEIVKAIRKDVVLADRVAEMIIEKVNGFNSNSPPSDRIAGSLLSVLRPVRQIKFSSGIQIKITSIMNRKIFRTYGQNSWVGAMTNGK
ncbi:MAG: hypothetical protein EOM84_04405 [Sphingobacteriia bacterium]|jgi:hypothetical protein|nr:hypothetical protein [Sphingobacteriia bacterium]